MGLHGGLLQRRRRGRLPAAVRELAIKNGITQRIPPQQDRDHMMRLGSWLEDAKVSAWPVNIAAVMFSSYRL